MFAKPSHGAGSSYLAAYSTQLAQLVRQRQAESALRDTQQRAEVLASSLRRVLEQTRAESDYLVNMSHELRTLLNAIIGFSSLMSEEAQGPLPERYREYATDIRASGNDLLALVQGFRGDAPDLPPERDLEETDIDLGALLRAAYQDVRGPAQDKNIKVQARLAKDLPALHADEGAIRQILVDLVGEAVRRSPEGSPVDVVLRHAEDGRLVLQVVNVEPPDLTLDVAVGPEGDQARVGFLAEIHQATAGVTKAGDGRRAATVAFPPERLAGVPAGTPSGDRQPPSAAPASRSEAPRAGSSATHGASKTAGPDRARRGAGPSAGTGPV